MKHRAAWRVLAALSLLAALWYITVPDDPAIRLCGFYVLTGRPCPLCGLTRALFALPKGHLAQAIRFNALSPLAFAMLFALFWSGRAQRILWTAGLAAFAVYGACRLFLAV